jgi:GNAT superfamily N-acetyltransferase
VSYTYVERVTTPQEHRALARAVGWGDAFVWDVVPASLAASVCGVVAVQDARVVGMGRVIGDGAFYFYLQDVAVDPAHQGRGVGSELVTRLLLQVERVAPPDAFVGLFAAEASGALYERYGFAVHPGMTGMYRGVGPAR